MFDYNCCEDKDASVSGSCKSIYMLFLHPAFYNYCINSSLNHFETLFFYSELKVLAAKNVEDSHKQLEQQVQTFIEKIDLNTKRIESAWVGLIAALLLIPIAFFLGKFL